MYEHEMYLLYSVCDRCNYINDNPNCEECDTRKRMNQIINEWKENANEWEDNSLAERYADC